MVDDEGTEVTEVSPSRRRPPQRRESTKLQSATKFLRALRSGKGDAATDGASPPDRSNPHYHSEGKANRRRAKQAKARGEQTERSHSFHDKVSKRSVTEDARRRDSIDSDAMQTDLSGDPPPTYENVISSTNSVSAGVITASGSGGRGDGRDEPTRPLQRDRERRSARKLTKDSGYETSPYSEADYASLSLRSESAETLTERRGDGEKPGRPALQQYLTEEYLIGVDTSRLSTETARRASVSEASEPGSVHSGSTLVPERGAEDGRVQQVSLQDVFTGVGGSGVCHEAAFISSTFNCEVSTNRLCIIYLSSHTPPPPQHAWAGIHLTIRPNLSPKPTEIVTLHRLSSTTLPASRPALMDPAPLCTVPLARRGAPYVCLCGLDPDRPVDYANSVISYAGSS